MKFYSALLLTILVFLGGCSRQEELNELLILTGIGVDLGENDTVKITFQAVNPQAQAGGESGGGNASQAQSYTFESEGEDMIEAVFNARALLSRKLFFSHISSLLVSEDFARERGIQEISDFVERHYDIRDNYLLFITKDTTASTILNTFTPLDNSSTKNLESLTKVRGGKLGINTGTKLEDFIRWRYGDDRDPVVMGVEKVDKQASSTNIESLNEIEGNKGALRLTGLALFDKDYLVDWLSYKDSISWSIITKKSNNVISDDIKCPGDQGTIGFLLKEMELKAEPQIVNEQLNYSVQLDGHINLQGLSCNIKLSTEQGVNELQTIINEDIENDLQTALTNAKASQLDYYGIKNQLSRNQPDEWKEMKDDWSRLYENMSIETEVNIYLESPGSRVDNNEG
ncbi:Ger(x)C family spore germination protein [Bacillus hwajinpoensis]|uniref:Ger(X)C family spore germination protein n=1 Tax=Guptibacillus hwajinpoensis TaxID=208199 RepID=A0A845F4P2_9BACL|nr:Ger(x)C family spore germination protein [Pseudalkalibacillus hwajinpoensis]MYL65731.1 Ger(x)C family spore germination protein [Pseudalkalibacillus hwajinpoensis]